MKEALGLVETMGLSNAILVADTMVKTSNIRIIDIERARGFGYMTIKILGDVGAINAAVTAGKQIAIENNAFVSAKVIPRPSDYIECVFCQSKTKETETKVKPKKNSKSKGSKKKQKQSKNKTKEDKPKENKTKDETKGDKDLDTKKEKTAVENKEVEKREEVSSVDNSKLEIAKSKEGDKKD